MKYIFCNILVCITFTQTLFSMNQFSIVYKKKDKLLKEKCLINNQIELSGPTHELLKKMSEVNDKLTPLVLKECINEISGTIINLKKGELSTGSITYDISKGRRAELLKELTKNTASLYQILNSATFNTLELFKKKVLKDRQTLARIFLQGEKKEILNENFNKHFAQCFTQKNVTKKEYKNMIVTLLTDEIIDSTLEPEKVANDPVHLFDNFYITFPKDK